MFPVPIPDTMTIEGAEKRTIKGNGANIEDVEAMVGVNAQGAPFFAMLVGLNPVDLRHLHLDPHFWLIQWGNQLAPHAFDLAFESPVADANDPITKGLQAIGERLAAAWQIHGAPDHGIPEGQAIALRARLSEIEALTRQLQLRSGVVQGGK